MARSLLAFDTDRVKQYVFATDKLREIRGASNVLDELNRFEMPRIVRDIGGEKIYSHGGSGLFVVETHRASEAIQKVQRAYADRTKGAASITGVDLELPGEFDCDSADLRPLWDHLMLKLDATKSRNPIARALVAHPLLRPCDSCGETYGSRLFDNELICLSCAAKRDRNITIRQERPQMPDDFNEIGAASRPDGYFALVYADGDGLGQELGRLKTLQDLKRFAEAVHASLKEANEEATHGLSPRCHDQLLLGGDDLLMVIQAQSAMEATLSLVEQFRDRTYKKLGRALTLSAAVVWAHVRFPLGTLVDLAESALKFAKTDGAKHRQAGEADQSGLVNFLVVSSASHLDFGQYYEQVLKLESPSEILHRTLRPYTPDGLRKLLGYRRAVGTAPRSKLEALRRAIFQSSREQSMLDGLITLLHWKDPQQRTVFGEMPQEFKPEGQSRFPWAAIDSDYYTPFGDLTEIWDFISGGDDCDAGE